MDGGSQRSAQAGEPAFDGAVGGAGARGDFGKRGALGVAGIEERAIFGGEFGEGGGERAMPERLRVFGGRRWIGGPERGEFCEEGGAALLAAGGIGGGAARGFGEPAPECVVIRDGAQAADGAEKSILHRLGGGVLVSPRHDEGVTLEPRGVLAMQFREGGLVPGADARCENRGGPRCGIARLSDDRCGLPQVGGQGFHGRCGEDEGACGHDFEMTRSAAVRTRIYRRVADSAAGFFMPAFSFIAMTVCSTSATASGVPLTTMT